MKILALDLGTFCGWSTNAQGRTESGVQVFDLKRGESPGMRYFRFNSWLDEMCACPPEIIVYEQPHHRGGAATEVSVGFSTRVQEYCAKRGIEHVAVHSGTLKKFWTGHGNASKEDMLFRTNMYRTATEYIKDHNESDAIAILHWAMVEFGDGD